MKSFIIRGASLNNEAKTPWDSINSSVLIRKGRMIILRYLSSDKESEIPLGVVLDQKTGEGKVIFNQPITLPEEIFIKTSHLFRSKKKIHAILSKSNNRKKFTN